jgi:hypothetical protein
MVLDPTEICLIKNNLLPSLVHGFNPESDKDTMIEYFNNFKQEYSLTKTQTLILFELFKNTIKQ